MLMNYLISAWRNLIKNGLFSAINIFGLALGMMSCILILLFVQDEVGYEKDIPSADRIVRLHSGYFPPGRAPFVTIRSAGRMMEAIKGYAPAQVQDGVRLLRQSFTVENKGEAFAEVVTFTDGSFFSIFDLPFIAGNPVTAFQEKNSLILSRDKAEKYFGSAEEAVGKTMTFRSPFIPEKSYKITAVMENMPRNSHMDIQLLIHMDPALFKPFPNLLDTWTSVNTYTYFKLKEGASVADLQARINDYINKESIFKDQIQSMADSEAKKTGKPAQKILATDVVKIRVMPITDIYLKAKPFAGNIGDMKTLGDETLVYTFSIVALLVLVIACINFMNLATARATGRAREVALRKVMGASRRQVAFQFLGEAVLVALIALLFALVAVELALPFYNDILNKDLKLDFLASPVMGLGLLGVAVFVGLVAGSYPALYLSGFLPARILKANKTAETAGSARFRFVLVLLQFSISIGLVVSTAVVYGQTYYVLTKNPGYVTGTKLVIPARGLSQSEQQSLANGLKTVSGVKQAVWSSEVPSQDNENNTFFQLLGPVGPDGQRIQKVLNVHSMDYGFFEAYGVKPLAGRLFDRAYGTDQAIRQPEGQKEPGKASAIINESALKSLGFKTPQEALGRRLSVNVFGAGEHELEIIGVIPDLYYRSLKFGVRASVYWNAPSNFRSVTIVHDRSDVNALKDDLQAVWRERRPMSPMTIQHLDMMIAAQYAEEKAQGQVYAVFAILAILIACMGLYGLASYTAERRTKEIGIRKVLGAGVMDIVRLLVWQFSKPVLFATLIAAPIAYVNMSEWLLNFEYRLGQEFIIVMILAAGAVAMVVSWMTVASRAWRVARANPIKALRYE